MNANVIPAQESVPPLWSEELRLIRRSLGAGSSRKILVSAHGVARLLTWCRRALAESHLVAVAATLHRALGADLDDLRALRLPVDILEQFPRWRAGSRAGFRPRDLGLRPAAAGAGFPLRALRLQLSPSSGTAPLALTLLRDLTRRLDPTVEFLVVAERGADLERVRASLRGLGIADGRVRVVEAASATIYAQDNARAAVDRDGGRVLLIPRAFHAHRASVAPAMEAAEAERALGAKIVRSALYWRGGNMVHDGERCLIGADTMAENRARLGLTHGEIVQSFRAELGTDVVVLGDPSAARFDAEAEDLTQSAQAAFHIDLDVSLLGRFGRRRRPVALVADPALGLRLLPHIVRHAVLARHFIPANGARATLADEFVAFGRERQGVLRAYADVLTELGYRVVGVPDLRLRPRANAFGAVNLGFSYCNVLPGLRGGRPAVHYLPWGVPALDRRAEARFRAAGVVPVKASSNPAIGHTLMQLSAGLRCFCGPLA
jgi:hypothetical protein